MKENQTRVLPGILAKIRQTKEREIESLLRHAEEEELRQLAFDTLFTAAPRDFQAVVCRHYGFPAGRIPVRLIAEIKRASPSRGMIREDFSPPELAKAYQTGGADAISCLTDVEYFQGRLNYLTQVRDACELPVLRKDFLIHPVQIYEARVAGADAVLLIARMLSGDEFQSLSQLASNLNMAVLCEVHDQQDLDMIFNNGCPELVGINNRDLDTFVVDKNTALKLRREIPENIPVVAESGIFTSEDMKKLADNNIQAALVGESLMRQSDVIAATRKLLAEDCFCV